MTRSVDRTNLNTCSPCILLFSSFHPSIGEDDGPTVGAPPIVRLFYEAWNVCLTRPKMRWSLQKPFHIMVMRNMNFLRCSPRPFKLYVSLLIARYCDMRFAVTWCWQSAFHSAYVQHVITFQVSSSNATTTNSLNTIANTTNEFVFSVVQFLD